MTAIHPVTDSSTLTVRCPADGRIVGTVQIDPPATVAAKVDALRVFQPEWEDLGPCGRKQWLLAYQEWVLDNAERITDLVQSESGKTRTDAGLEAPMIATVIDYVASRAERFLTDQHPRSFSPLAVTKKLTTTYRPYPVVGVITPWNFPFMMPGIDVVPALAAGAAVLLKPSEVTPLSAVEFARGWAEIGAPPVLSVVAGYGDTGAAVVAGVDFVQFTGSTATGRKVAVACAERLIPYSLELGGKDPASSWPRSSNASAGCDRAMMSATSPTTSGRWRPVRNATSCNDTSKRPSARVPELCSAASQPGAGHSSHRR
jgi:acyl-CoA reductase-like NAD-dependent aldehyde dehydrogenase